MKPGIKVLICLAAGILCLLAGMGVGSVSITPGDMAAIVGSRITGSVLPEHIPEITASILWDLRMPRAVMAFLTGTALAASGAVMQSLLRNPLASGYTLGVSSGASLAAAAAIVSGFTLPLPGGYTLSRFDRNLENTTVILTGMVISLFVNAILTLITAFSKEHLQQLVFWQMGSFSGQSWHNCAVMLAVVSVGVLILTRYGWEMDLITFGEEQALSAGVELKRVKIILIVLTSLLTGSAVAFVGVIGFIDLISPHVVRRLFGSSHRIVVPVSALFGGSFMVLADLAARTIVSPEELPVGAVTALIGAPFFAYVYFIRRKGEHRA